MKIPKRLVLEADCIDITIGHISCTWNYGPGGKPRGRTMCISSIAMQGTTVRFSWNVKGVVTKVLVIMGAQMQERAPRCSWRCCSQSRAASAPA